MVYGRKCCADSSSLHDAFCKSGDADFCFNTLSNSHQTQHSLLRPHQHLLNTAKAESIQKWDIVEFLQLHSKQTTHFFPLMMRQTFSWRQKPFARIFLKQQAGEGELHKAVLHQKLLQLLSFLRIKRRVSRARSFWATNWSILSSKIVFYDKFKSETLIFTL